MISMGSKMEISRVLLAPPGVCAPSSRPALSSHVSVQLLLLPSPVGCCWMSHSCGAGGSESWKEEGRSGLGKGAQLGCTERRGRAVLASCRCCVCTVVRALPKFDFQTMMEY